MPRSKIVRFTTEELKEMARRGKTKTDWKRVKATKEKDIIVGQDSPEITAEMWRNALRLLDRFGDFYCQSSLAGVLGVELVMAASDTGLGAAPLWNGVEHLGFVYTVRVKDKVP